MLARATCAVLCLLTALPSTAADKSAGQLLAKAVAAFERNQQNERHWNWTISETREMRDKSGIVMQKFPEVKSESVILGDGRRCNAVTAWGDGHQAYLKDAGAEERCQAYNALMTPFNVTLLLKSATARISARSAEAITIAVEPDKHRQHDPDFGVRCAASIEATIRLDPATSFPLSIEGKVVDNGCTNQFTPVMHETPLTRAPMTSNFRKTAAFRVVYALQKDRFDNPANSYWIAVSQHYDQPAAEGPTVLYYWGRQFRVRGGGHRLIKDIATTSQEFGAGSQLTFK
jgi:hypothetical protein